jgi:hypothetical protein
MNASDFTPKQLQAIRIAVAEAAGRDPWFRCPQHSEVTPDHATLGTLCPWCAETLEWWDGTNGPLPDYTGDLNAVHEVENSLNDDQHYDFRGHLVDVTYSDIVNQEQRVMESERAWISAPALQRCIALLMTLAPDKWKAIKNDP